MTDNNKPVRKFRAWYTHECLELTLDDIRESAECMEIELKFADPDNPTMAELEAAYTTLFEEMSDPWEITANGRCKVEEVTL